MRHIVNWAGECVPWCPACGPACKHGENSYECEECKPITRCRHGIATGRKCPICDEV